MEYLTQYGRRVAELEAQGLTRSDAQGVADTEGLDDTLPAVAPQATKQALIDALDAFIRQRPGFEPGNYSDAASYRADVRRATRQRHDAERFLRDIELRDSITADDILREAQGGRVEIERVPACTAPMSPTNKMLITTPEFFRIHYTAGQYYCTEYRAAVARLLAGVLWDRAREDMIAADGRSDGDALRARFRREFGRGLASRYFN